MPRVAEIRLALIASNAIVARIAPGSVQLGRAAQLASAMIDQKAPNSVRMMAPPIMPRTRSTLKVAMQIAIPANHFAEAGLLKTEPDGHRCGLSMVARTGFESVE